MPKKQKVKKGKIFNGSELAKKGKVFNESARKWVYNAIDSNGSKVNGDIIAISYEDALLSLRQKGLFVTTILLEEETLFVKYNEELKKTRESLKSMYYRQIDDEEEKVKFVEIASETEGFKKPKKAKKLDTLKKLNLTSDKTFNEEVRSKIFLDLLAAPETLLPFVMGCTALIASWIFGSVLLAAGGIMGTVIGVGVFLTKFIFGMNKLSKDAHEHVMQQQEKANNKVLDKLDEALQADHDPRPESCLRQLRSLKLTIVERAKTNPLGSQLLDNFNRLFEVCVKQIEDTYDIWREACDATPANRTELLEKREKIVREIEEATSHLVKTVEELKAVETVRTESELSEAQQELVRTLEIAKRTEERLADIHNRKKIYDPKEFET